MENATIRIPQNPVSTGKIGVIVEEDYRERNLGRGFPALAQNRHGKTICHRIEHLRHPSGASLVVSCYDCAAAVHLNTPVATGEILFSIVQPAKGMRRGCFSAHICAAISFDE